MDKITIEITDMPGEEMCNIRILVNSNINEDKFNLMQSALNKKYKKLMNKAYRSILKNGGKHATN